MIDFKQISIVGFGLIGASLAKALRERGFDGKIFAVDQDQSSLRLAHSLGIIDGIGVKGSDLVILALPVGQFDKVLVELADELEDDCLITDVASVKLKAHKTIMKHLKPRQRFLGGHPMVGSEQSGFESSKSHLFENAYYFLTALEDNDEDLSRLKAMVELIGAKYIEINPQRHDEIVARTSHLPHISAAVLVNVLNDYNGGLIDYVGGGFRDTTRIASGNPDLWTDILMNNSEEIIRSIDLFIANLSQMRMALEENDSNKVKEQFKKAKDYREMIPKHLSDSIAKLHTLYIDVKDQPGVIAIPTALLAEKKISIRDIEIVHARERTPGVLRIGFYSDEDRIKAAQIIKDSDYGKVNPVYLGGE